jgi:biotin-(acetyl-CoA carboxylase) ligase
MPTGSKIRRAAPISPRLDLPPPFRAVTLREVGDAFVHAVAIAAEGGAGTLVHVGRFGFAEFAVVLEPDEPLRTARRAMYTGMCALGDALAAIAPPEKAISFEWPGAVRVDGGLVGGARLAWPLQAREDERPAWLVFGVMIRLVAMGEAEPGLRPPPAALDDEGTDSLDGGVLAAHFARHLMAVFDAVQEKGFGEVARSYLSRLAPEWAQLRKVGPADDPNAIRRDIDHEGNLLIRYPDTGKVEQRSLTGALAAPSWIDQASGTLRR